ncbi:MAG: ABC transporter permease [Spirochaetes bacterium]|nr:ABC transporter permease [Spirochaetota bacterium]
MNGKGNPKLLSLLTLLFALWNGCLTLFHGWTAFWWLGLGVDFLLIVGIAELIGKRIPPLYAPLYRRSLSVSFPLLLFLAWELLVRGGVLSPDWFPPPSRIVQALWELITKFDEFSKTSLLGRPWLLLGAAWGNRPETVKELLAESHLYATLMRVFVGFFLGATPGILLGMVMGVSPTIRTMIDATLSAFYVLPKIAIFPIMMLIFPDPFGEGPKIAVVAISVFFLVTINTMVGVRDIEPVYLEAGRNYGASGFRLFYHVILPGALPVVFAGLRIALGTALIVIIAVEFVRAKTGVGFLTFYYWEILSPEKMYAGLVVVMVLGVLLTAGLKKVEQWVMPWRKP